MRLSKIHPYKAWLFIAISNDFTFGLDGRGTNKNLIRLELIKMLPGDNDVVCSCGTL